MKSICLALGAVALSAHPAFAQEAQSDADWYPSEYGADDRLGAVANLSAEKTARAARLIETGKTYALGQITSRETPAYAPRRYDVYVMQPSDGSGVPMGENKAVGNDDLVQTFVGIGSQIDGLGHMGIDHLYYNGVHVSEFVTPAGLTQMGTQDIPPIATRGVLLDMTAIFGESPVPDGTAFNRAEIEQAAERAGVTIEKGDVVLFHTGAMEAHGDSTELMATHPGLGVEGANYLADLGVVAIGADSTALEAIPFENPARPFEVHQTLLAKRGVYILENMVTTELAVDGVTEFFFSLGIPRLNGTVQAIINPVAIR
ncbi:cyclase family protein [Henriciella barbarensis]|uniref:Cyclase family protein n=1 Tax=Henriciella barbarensis TaxID=86342 RepID=A0A399R458_9PROT|nr:cyclase family protein [Henriciella barbarensis]RIJ26336.1 cyclase family protein [Henriciella barbarensis]